MIRSLGRMADVTAAQMVNLFDRYVSALNGRRRADALAIVAGELDHNGERMTGAQWWDRHIAANVEALPDYTWTVDEMIPCGERVIVRYTVSGTLSRPWVGLTSIGADTVCPRPAYVPAASLVSPPGRGISGTDSTRRARTQPQDRRQAAGDNEKMSEPTAQREPESNQAERRRWNDPVWVARWLNRQALTSAVSGYLLDSLAPADGERILEIGSGAGPATLALAAAVPRGAVTGADISRPLSGLARQRARGQDPKSTRLNS